MFRCHSPTMLTRSFTQTVLGDTRFSWWSIVMPMFMIAVMPMFMIFGNGNDGLRVIVAMEAKTMRVWNNCSNFITKVNSPGFTYFFICRCTFTWRRKTQKHSWYHATIWILYGTHIRYVHCPNIKMVLFKIARRKNWDWSCLCFENHLWSAGCMKPFDPAGSRPKPVQINSLLSLSYFSSHRKNIGREFDFWSPSMNIDYIPRNSGQKPNAILFRGDPYYGVAKILGVPWRHDTTKFCLHPRPELDGKPLQSHLAFKHCCPADWPICPIWW